QGIDREHGERGHAPRYPHRRRGAKGDLRSGLGQEVSPGYPPLGGPMNRRFLLATFVGALLAPTVFSWTRGGAEEETPQAPLGLPPIFWPEDNPFTPAKAELGKLLFFDKRLSSDGSVACASCHDPARAFGDGAANSLGIGGQRGGRSAPTVINR